MAVVTSPATNSQDNPLVGFGPNEWIVEDMYQRFLADPSSVDPAWHDFFADYRPDQGEPASTTGRRSPPRQRPPHQPPPLRPPLWRPPPRARHLLPPLRPRQPRPRQPRPRPPPLRPRQLPSARRVRVLRLRPRPAAPAEPQTTPIRGVAAKIVSNMDASLQVPTATSVRAVPAKLLADNRVVINNHLARGRGGKVSFTHIIGFAIVKALAEHPEMNNSFATSGGKPVTVSPGAVNLGIAIDLAKPDGSRILVVPSIKNADAMDFRQFWQSYEDLIRRARRNELTMDDYAGTTISLTNPGGIGTVHSMPRLMQGQGTIIGVGAMEHPAEFAGMSDDQLADLAISKVITLTSTYDHRIIQGAQSGEFLKVVHELLLGAHEFYDDIFTSLRIPYEPIRWTRDVAHTSEGQIDKTARVIELIHAYRVRGHLMADTDPLEFHIRHHPDLDVRQHDLTLWDLDRTFPVGGFAGKQRMKLRDILGVLRDSYCRRIGIEYMHIQDPEERRWIQERVERRYTKLTPEEQRHVLVRLNAAEAFETFLQTKFVGQKRFSLEGSESVIPLLRRDPHCRRPRQPGRGRYRHGPPRPAQRARQHRGQAVRKDLLRVRGPSGPEVHDGFRRRQVPPRPDREVHHPRWRVRDHRERGGQPVAPGGGRPGPRRASCGPSRTASTSSSRATPCCRCWCTAMPRSPVRAWSPRR